MIIKFKRLHPNAVLPYKSFRDDFCYDVVATTCEQIAPDVYRYGLGFALQAVTPKHSTRSLAITFRPRSSVWKTGMILSNSVGTIDKGYTGEIMAVFHHINKNLPIYKVGDRIGQIHLSMTTPMEFAETETLEPTDRADGGYGSTGK